MWWPAIVTVRVVLPSIHLSVCHMQISPKLSKIDVVRELE